MGNQYFEYGELLSPPIRRAAYSDRTAWLLAKMSKLAYLPFENDDKELKVALAEADFSLIKSFSENGTQAFLAKKDASKMAVLSFRGTQLTDLRDIVTDLETRFYQENGIKIHNGFHKAFKCVEDAVTSAVKEIDEYSLYVTGHSLGGALALIATRALNSDNLAACYTFGSPKVGTEEFGDDIKPPIYRIVNAYDIVPVSPPTYFFGLLHLLPWEKLRNYLKQFLGYDHQGDMRYLSPCKEPFEGLKILCNYNELFRLVGVLMHKADCIQDHAIDTYCAKLAKWALMRRSVK